MAIGKIRKYSVLCLAIASLLTFSNVGQAEVTKEDPSKYFDDAGSYYILGGDILLDKEDPIHQELINTILKGNSNTPTSRSSFFHNKYKKWADGKVPYHFTQDITKSERKQIISAMQKIEAECDVDFYDSGETDDSQDVLYRLKIIHDEGNGNLCTLGYVKNPVFKYTKTKKEGTVIHELLHCLGYSHENQRYDAVTGGYITVNFDNIKEGHEKNFNILPMKLCEIYTPYDYDSIMHYSNKAFAIDPNIPTIDSKGHKIGQRAQLSDYDKISLVKKYGKYSMSSPVEGDSYNGTISINGYIADSRGISKIEILIDGQCYATAGYNPDNYEFRTTIHSASLSEGSHELSVRVTTDDDTQFIKDTKNISVF